MTQNYFGQIKKKEKYFTFTLHVSDAGLNAVYNKSSAVYGGFLPETQLGRKLLKLNLRFGERRRLFGRVITFRFSRIQQQGIFDKSARLKLFTNNFEYIYIKI